MYEAIAVSKIANFVLHKLVQSLLKWSDTVGEVRSRSQPLFLLP